MRNITEVRVRVKAKKIVAPKAALTSGKHSDNLIRLARIKGQIEGIERMLREGRYCPEILQQVKSVGSAIKGLEGSVLEGHIRGCVRKALTSDNAFESEDNELMNLFRST
jgi:DNA-binding FrmR family transcriptional regulator